MSVTLPCHMSRCQLVWVVSCSLFVPRLLRNVINKANPVSSSINQDYRFLFNDGGWTFRHWNVQLLRKWDLCWASVIILALKIHLRIFPAPENWETKKELWSSRRWSRLLMVVVLVLLVGLWRCDNTDITQDTHTDRQRGQWSGQSLTSPSGSDCPHGDKETPLQ